MNTHVRILVSAETSSEYGRRFLQGVAEEAGTSREWEMQLTRPNDLARRISPAYDGYICRVANRREENALAATGKPVVDVLCATGSHLFQEILSDAAAIGALAADHFLSRRFRNLAFCGYRHLAFSDRRRNAYVRHIEKCGIRPFIYRPPYSPQEQFDRSHLFGENVDTPPDAEELANWLRRLPKPVGVFCCDDLRASNIAAACRTLGLSVPADIAVLGVDDDPVFCRFCTPELSSIDPDATEIGRTAVRELRKRLADPAGAPRQIVIPPRGILSRASTDVYPGAPALLAEAMGFIRSHVGDNISASDVFRHVGRSYSHVGAVFAKYLGSSVQKEIAAARLALAENLLRTTALPIAEIAARSGFSSAEYMTRTFTAAFGHPPSAHPRRRD